MAEKQGPPGDFSARRIIGFACNQAFVFFTLFGMTGAGWSFERPGFFCLLLFMVVGFVLLRLMGEERIERLFARPLLYLFAVVAAAGALIPLAGIDSDIVGNVARGVLAGVPSAVLLAAWGRAFGREPSRVAVPEVFLGSLVAALVCLAFSFSQSSPVVMGAVCLLPLANVVNIDVSAPGDASAAPGPASGQADLAQSLSAKVITGTFLFGAAAGLLVLSRGESDVLLLSGYQVSLVLYGAFLIGSLTLLLSDGFGRGAALNKSYRLAVFVMMTGVLLVPLPSFAISLMPGESVVMAGFMGLQAVFISLFVVVAEITGSDCTQSFSTGFLALFAGELVGALAALGMFASFPSETPSYAVVVLAGVVTLMGYIFLFTERDFDALSQLVKEEDTFDEACERIATDHGLTKRESEILAFALRGRTSERIAQELVISKSTVDTHLRRIYAKCGVHSRQELIDLMEGSSVGAGSLPSAGASPAISPGVGSGVSSGAGPAGLSGVGPAGSSGAGNAVSPGAGKSSK